MPQVDFTLLGLPSFSFLRRNAVSDEEAVKLYEMWAKSPPGGEIVAARAEAKALEAKGLIRARGMQEGTACRFALTPEGKKIIIEMVTNVPNSFQADAKLPSYSKIKSKAKRARQTFIKRAGREGYDVEVRVDGF
jgi:hypothetical protein